MDQAEGLRKIFSASGEEARPIAVVVAPERPALAVTLAAHLLQPTSESVSPQIWVDEIALRYREDIALPTKVRFLLDQVDTHGLSPSDCFHQVRHVHYAYNPQGWDLNTLRSIERYTTSISDVSRPTLVTSHPQVIPQLARHIAQTRLVLIYSQSSKALLRAGSWINYLFSDVQITEILFILCRQQYQVISRQALAESIPDNISMKTKFIVTERDDIFNLPANGAWIAEKPIIDTARNMLR